jgi:DNA-directed RNA polymerase II subunit RPB2
MYEDNLHGLIQQNFREIFNERSLEIGFKKAYKGNWGAQTHTKRIGVVQDLNRLSFNGYLAHMRKTNLALPSSAKIIGPRVLHGSQWGFIDAIDTPDGGNIGLHKSLAISTHISQGASREPILAWLREKIAMKLLEECKPRELASMTKIMVNGLWAGAINTPTESIEKMRLYRRNALIPVFTSISFNIKQNTIYIYTDAGRLCRPIIYHDNMTGKLSIKSPEILGKLEEDDFSWEELVHGFNKKKEKVDNKVYELYDLYDGVGEESNPAVLDRFIKNKAILEYIDSSESESALIAMNIEEYQTMGKRRNFTHCEIHESLTYGIMCNQINYLENNPVTRNAFSCGHAKQAVSLYHTNYQVRMDKTAVVLNCGQIPLIKTRYNHYINHDENVSGVNVIVAIMVYTGYNMEDAVLINQGALDRGLFRTTYYTTYEAHEESSKNAHTVTDKKFTNIEREQGVIGTKPGYNYSELDRFGIIRENTVINDKTILIGMTSNNTVNPESRIDMSKGPKKGQLGTVDKTFITEGEEGERIAKVRIREERIPAMGDKMASRAGQKGTIGLVIPEIDMPFCINGIRPDIIVNPHAIPSRMTIGQLIESLTGKACANYGAFGDCTAFINRGSKIGVFGELLLTSGYHSSGNEILYNGTTGEQIETEIFIGPTYYQRLKHMVKDKINYRARGPNAALTKQPVSGRANDGGLRIGEMERDSVISHGMTQFLTESMMERGDKYYAAICNNTGLLAIYNPSKNLFMSPMADGPIQYTGSLDNSSMNIQNITKFGRNFSIICIPYTLKLLIQELQTMNIQMRIITEDNIEQLENMSFSKNLDTLFKNKTPKDIVDETKAIISGKKIEKEPTKLGRLRIPEYNSPKSPELPPPPARVRPTSPDFPPPPPRESTSPDFPPPIPTHQRNDSLEFGQGDSQEYEFSIEDIVRLRGDSKPNRKWTITDIQGDFITIETEDMTNLEDESEYIKVVKKEDILLASNLPIQQPSKPRYGGDNENTNEFDENINGGRNNNSQPAIYFAPTIIAGDHNRAEMPNTNGSMGGGNMSGNMSSGEIVTNEQSVVPNIINQGNNTQGGRIVETMEGGNTKYDKISGKKDSSFMGSVGNGIIDFANNFLIKKMP